MRSRILTWPSKFIYDVKISALIMNSKDDIEGNNAALHGKYKGKARQYLILFLPDALRAHILV